MEAAMAKAKEQERKLEWLEAAKSYEQALRSGATTVALKAETWKRKGFCYSRASSQAEDPVEFKKLTERAGQAYKKASQLFDEDGSLGNKARSAHCRAIALYVRSHVASSPSDKRKMFEECLRFGNASLETYKKAGDELGYGEMCNELSSFLLEMQYLASDWIELQRIVDEGLDRTEKAVAVFSKLANKPGLLRAYFLASLVNWYAHNSMPDKKELAEKSLVYSEKALKLSEEVGDPYYAAMSNWAAAFCSLFFREEVESALKYAEEMLRKSETAKDNYLKGVASYVLAFVNNWMVLQEEDPDKRKEGHEKVIKHSEDAIHFLEFVGQDYFIAQSYWFYAETYSSLTREIVASLEEKRAMSEKAVETGRQGVQHANCSGSPDAEGTTRHALSKALHFHSALVPESEKKRKLLEEALVHRRKYIDIAKKVFPLSDWIQGVGKHYEGLIEADLARMEIHADKKMAFLESAVSDMEDGRKHYRKWIDSERDPVPTRIAAVGGFEGRFAETLKELYSITKNKETLIKAIDVYNDAAENFKRLNLSSRVAEFYWKIAESQDQLDEHQKAAENFENAFAEYKFAAQRIPHFVGFFQDYAKYMKAWSEIERAKFAHKNEDYVTAVKYYEEAADLLKQSELWSYLSSNFLAWASLEQAEDLSRKESCAESIEAFQKASVLFKESGKVLQTQSSRIENEDERDLVRRLARFSGTRQKYCLGRIAIEEARILDSQGEHVASSERYGLAAETFNEILKAESEQNRRELKPLIYLCQAWQKMLMAEAKASSAMYEEAARLFNEAKEHTLDQRSSLLALANSSFCRALGAGTQFEISREHTQYSIAKRHMEAAANHYLKAGFKSASEYAKATELLFDAYVYMDKAKIETAPEKKTVYYTLAERVLKVSAQHFGKAKHREKTEQVQQLLEKVEEDRDLAVSLSQVLHVPTITSSTSSFAMLTPGEERAVGLERFERADIQAKLVQNVGEIRVGEEVSLEMQIVNVGKEAVLLTRVEEIIPAGFQLVKKPDYCKFDNAHLDMKGKRLDPLKTEEIGLVLRSFEKGTFKITPRIVCVDETGHQMFRGPDPVTVSVSEVVLPGRVATGNKDLDNLLYGGIPENYTVILTSPSCDERDLLIKKFLEKGAKDGQITFYVTIEASGVRDLIEDFQSNLYLFICNPRADTIVKSLPNVFKLKGVENLTEIDIALISAFRRIDNSSKNGLRRACIDIVSDVLLQHHAVTARKWLTGLIPDLRSRGFTTLAVINPYMHPPQEVQAMLGLFEGEINIYEKETMKGSEKFLKVKKLYNQKYLESELPLRKEKLETY